MLALITSPVRAAEGSAATATAKPRVTTVRVDTGTGRLVRVRGGSSPAKPSSSAKSVAPVKSTASTSRAILAAREAAKVTPTVDGQQIRHLVETAARKHGVDPELVHSVVRAESNYQQKAISPKGALGLMQLIPATAERFGVENPFDPSQNLDGGVRYLKFLSERYQGNLPLVLAAYNAGEGAVARHAGIPPYRETREYVTKITRSLAEGTETGNARSPVTLAAVASSAVAGSDSGVARGSGNMDNLIAPRQTAVRMYTDNEGRLHLETIQ